MRLPKDENARNRHQRLLKGKRYKNQRKPVMKNIPDLRVIFTFEESISTSHVCPKGQQPYIRIV